ncbi:MAG: 50S ribosomal protein P1 [Candidatus Aenigmarchaeota archaeon]|nr:50S ribosomal protein P1 [Candidatus Aenigmarchaeota archaeon]
MELVYASLILHSIKQPVSEENIKKIMQAAGATPDGAKIKALVAALEGVNIDEAMKQAVMAQAAPAAPVAEAKKEEEKKDEQAQEQAVAGLGSLFG